MRTQRDSGAVLLACFFSAAMPSFLGSKRCSREICLRPSLLASLAETPGLQAARQQVQMLVIATFEGTGTRPNNASKLPWANVNLPSRPFYAGSFWYGMPLIEGRQPAHFSKRHDYDTMITTGRGCFPYLAPARRIPPTRPRTHPHQRAQRLSRAQTPSVDLSRVLHVLPLWLTNSLDRRASLAARSRSRSHSRSRGRKHERSNALVASRARAGDSAPA